MQYAFSEIVDISALQALMDSQFETSGITMALLDTDGNPLVKSGWQKICLEFHRKNSEMRQRCQYSDLTITRYVKKHGPPPGGCLEYRCQNGLMSMSFPIIIDNRHIASLFTGQYLNAPPDENFFRKQAARYGFNPTDYLEALRKVPIYSRENLQKQITFLGHYVTLITRMGLQKLNELNAQKRIDANEKRLRSIFEISEAGITLVSPQRRFLEVNPAFCRITGYTEEELLTMSISDLTPDEDRDAIQPFLEKPFSVFLKNSNHERRYLRKDRKIIWVHISTTMIFTSDGDPDYIIGIVQDITQRKEAEEKLKERQAFESLIGEISSKFVKLPLSKTDEGIDLALEKLGKFVGADCTYVFLLSKDGTKANNTHEWHAEGRPSLKELGQNIDLNDFPWAAQKMKGKKAIFLPRVADLPLGASAEKEHWKKELRENGSLLVVPILSQGELIGLLCFDGSLSEQQSKEKDITQLQTVADIIGSTLERQRVGKALEKSQERLNLALQTANEGVWDWDLDSDRLYFGPRYYTMLGYDPNEFPPSYKTWLGLLHPEDREGAKKLAKEFLAKGKKFETEFRMRAKDGRYIDILSTGKGVAFDEKGKPVRLVGTHRDITLRKKTQNELQKSKALLAESQRITGLGSWEMDLITKQISWSDQLYRLVGKHPENFTPNSESLFELIHPDDKKPMKQAFKRALNGNSKYHLEHRVIRDDGEIRHFEVQGEIKFDKTGRGLKAIGTVLDITKRKKTEKLLKKALDETEKAHVQVDAIFKSVSDGLIYTDTTNRILLMNHPAETLLDLKFAKVKGKTLDTFIQDENLIQNFGFLNSNGTEHAQTELDLACNGEIRNIQARSSVVREKNGNKAGIITLLCDVTREREVDRLKSEFISTAAHELRTPLTSVKGFSELLISQDFDQPTREEFLSIIHEKAKVLEKIVADMLNLSRVESGRIIHLETSPCELSEILNDWAEAFCRESTKHPLELFLPNSKTRLFIDKEKIVQVLDNLASNAAKFSAPGTLIQLVCEKNDQEFRVSTKDQGIGMTPEQSKRIFDKFYRVDASNTSAPGLGLGMAIAKSIVEAHGGRIWVESVFGQGTTATFTLPMNLAESP